MFELRPDQIDAKQQMRQALRERIMRFILQCPTGFGKTIVAADIAESVRERKNRLLMTVPALALVQQTVEKFWKHKIHDIGVIQSDNRMTDLRQPVQIASVQTLMRMPIEQIPQASVVILDEIHIWFEFYARWMRHPAWQNVPFIGQSATPWQKGLGNYFDRLIRPTTIQQMIDQRLLCDFEVMAPNHPDFSSARKRGDDYHPDDVSEIMRNTAGLTGDIVQTWLKHGRGRPTFVFAVDRAHARKIQEEYEKAGVRAAYQDGFTKDHDSRERSSGEWREGRRGILKKFRSGEYEMIISVGTLGIGVDEDVRCIQDCQGTLSEMKQVQKIGRGLRPADGKDYCLVLDHAGNHEGRFDRKGRETSLGYVTDIDVNHTALYKREARDNTARDMIRLPKCCPECGYLKAPGTALCPNCQFVAVAHSTIEPTPGELKKTKRQRKEANGGGEILPQMFMAECKAIAMQKGWKPGFAYKAFVDRYKQQPSKAIQNVAPATVVSKSTRDWLTSQFIRRRFAKNRSNIAEGREAVRRASQELGDRMMRNFVEREVKQAAQEPERKFVQGTLMTQADFEDL
jgi:DNA repair protein RadD